MANPKKLLLSAAIAAGLPGGGVAGVVLGVPGTPGAQTAAGPDAANATAAPDGTTTTDRPAGDAKANCPDHEGTVEPGARPGTGPV
jgi:hypothetical protein